MYRSGHVRRFLLSAIAALLTVTGPAFEADPAWADQLSPAKDFERAQTQGTTVTLRWVARPGVSRYRLQLARDAGFTDIVFDRVIDGTSYEVTDLPAGKYFWRVAALTTKLGDFSSAGVVTVSEQHVPSRKNAEPSESPAKTESFITGDGWRAAIGAVRDSVLGHLRSTSRSEIVAINASGVMYALDAASGIALWVAPPLKSGPRSTFASAVTPALIRSTIGLDDVIALVGSSARRFDGATGRELWHATIPATVLNAVVLDDGHTGAIYVVDASLRTLFILNANDGAVITKAQLPARVIGAPMRFEYRGMRAAALAYENGRIEIRDESAKVIGSGDTASTNTTAPLFVRSPRAGLILVGTKSGLTALDAADLHPLGRVVLQNDAPRGSLMAADLDNDGNAEVIMLTERGHVVAVHAADGKIIWQSDAIDAQAVTFADINRDGVMDVVATGRQTFASVLSGRDGSLLWKTDKSPVGASDSKSLVSSIMALPLNSGTLLIGSDAQGLHAVEIHKAQAR